MSKKMATYYQIVLDDLSLEEEEYAIDYEPPYDAFMSFDRKFDLTKKAMLRAKRLQNRTLQLLSAYFLGQLLETQTESSIHRGSYICRLSPYYRVVVVRTYYIFEVFGTKKVMSTLRTSLTTIRRLKKVEFQNLVLQASTIFNGVEN
jgi:hypothetical protein